MLWCSSSSSKGKDCFHFYTILFNINFIFVCNICLFQKIKLYLLVLMPISRHPFYRDLGIKELYRAYTVCNVTYTPLLCQGDAVLAPYTANSNAYGIKVSFDIVGDWATLRQALLTQKIFSDLCQWYRKQPISIFHTIANGCWTSLTCM